MKRIENFNSLTSERTIQDLVSSNKQARNLLQSIGLDPDHHREKTLRSVCTEKQWNETELLNWLKRENATNPAECKSNPQANDLDFSCWEEFQDQNMELLSGLRSSYPRVYKVHGIQYPWLKEISWYYEQFDESLNLYLRFEQIKLMPLMRRFQKNAEQTMDGDYQKLLNGVRIIEKDQDRIQWLIEKMNQLSNEFTIEESACSTLRIMNQKFIKLFDTVHAQFEIERDLLLPMIKSKLNGV